MKKQQGFTLIEVLLVVAAIAILAGIVILAINPTKQLADARDTKRSADVNTILNAVYQHAIDNDGTLISLPGSATEICGSNSNCSGLTNLNALTNNSEYLTAIPSDPNGDCDPNGVCYEILQTAAGRVTVSAPDAENGTISATR